MNDVVSDIKKTIPSKSTVIVATSGGPDSMCLLDLLNKETDLKIICAHVNHKLREESNDEAEMVKKYCTGNNITYEYYEISDYKGNTEGYAREKRYSFFENLIKKYNSKYLLTAHHGDDLVETVLMKLSRGNINSINGFSRLATRDGYYIYRPLIIKTKEDILNYLEKNNIEYAVDETNFSDLYTRNRFRKYVLPPLKKENKNIHLNFIKLGEMFEKQNNYIDSVVNKVIKKVYKNEIINIDLFLKQDDFIKEKIIYKLLKEKYGDNIKLIKNEHILSILDSINNDKPNIMIDLPLNYIFIKEYNEGRIICDLNGDEYDFILEDEVILPDNSVIRVVDESSSTSNYVIRLNTDEIKLPLHIRSKKDGDKIRVKGMNGHKKVKDIFIDEKVPLKQRNGYPILTDSDDIVLWIPGIKKSEFDKSKTKNYDIIVKYFSERKF